VNNGSNASLVAFDLVNYFLHKRLVSQLMGVHATLPTGREPLRDNTKSATGTALHAVDDELQERGTTLLAVHGQRQHGGIQSSIPLSRASHSSTRKTMGAGLRAGDS
jgi:hypothetical protein